MYVRNVMPDEDLDTARARDRAAGICPAEQLTDHARNVLMTNIPWMCSLDVDHTGEHQVWVFATFTDGRPGYCYMCHAWSG